MRILMFSASLAGAALLALPLAASVAGEKTDTADQPFSLGAAAAGAESQPAGDSAGAGFGRGGLHRAGEFRQ